MLMALMVIQHMGGLRLKKTYKMTKGMCNEVRAWSRACPGDAQCFAARKKTNLKDGGSHASLILIGPARMTQLG